MRNYSGSQSVHNWIRSGVDKECWMLSWEKYGPLAGQETLRIYDTARPTWNLSTNLQKLKNDNLLIFPQTRNSNMRAIDHEVNTGWKSWRAKLIKSDKDRICRICSATTSPRSFLDFSCDWQIPGGVRVIWSCFSCDGILSDGKQCPQQHARSDPCDDKIDLLPQFTPITLLDSFGELGHWPTSKGRSRA